MLSLSGEHLHFTEGLWETNSWLRGLSEEMFKTPLEIQVEKFRYSGLGKLCQAPFYRHLVASPQSAWGRRSTKSLFVFSKNKLGNVKISKAWLGRNAVTMTTIFWRLVSFEHFARRGSASGKLALLSLFPHLPRSLHKEHIFNSKNTWFSKGFLVPATEGSFCL